MTSRVAKISIGSNGRQLVKAKNRSHIEVADQTPSMPANPTPVGNASPDAANLEGQDQPLEAPTIDESTK